MMLGAAALGTIHAMTFDFSYVDKSAGGFGSSTAETYDVAIFLPGETFGGFTIKQINAPINASGVSCYSDPSIWLSSSLKMQGNTFTPDISSWPVTIPADGTMTTTLTDGYVIPAEGVYAGFSFTVTELNGASQYPLMVGECDDPNALLCRTNKTLTSWTSLPETYGVGSLMSVVLEKENMAPVTVKLVSIPNHVYLNLGESASIDLELSSTSTESVSSVDIDYVIDGKSGTNHIDLAEPVEAGLGKIFSVTLNLPAFEQKFAGECSFEVAKVNGVANGEANQNKLSTYIAAFTDGPAHQTLIEEYTGTWCSWCPGGYAMLEYIKKNEPDFVVAAYHNNDPMQVTTAYPSKVPGYPSVYLDRQLVMDPMVGTGRFSGIAPIVQDVKYFNSQPTPWGIKVDHKWIDENTLEADAEVWNVVGMENGEYRLVYILVADGLTGTTQSWFQLNAYASRVPLNTYVEELKEFCRGGKYGSTRVVGLTFNDVVVSTTGIYGVDGSIPATLAENEKATHSITFDLSKINSKLIPDKNKLRVIAAVVDKNGIVHNCAKNEVNDFDNTAVEGIDADSNMPEEYYTVDGMKVSDPSHGVYIKRRGGVASKVVIP